MTTRARSKRGRPQGLSLTETDLKILNQVAKEGFQTYQELRVGILKSYGRTWAWDLLKRLVTNELLIACPSDRGGILGWTISKKGADIVKKHCTQGIPGPIRPLLYKSSFEHDLVLRELRQVLCKSPCIAGWVPEHILKAQTMAKIGFRVGSDRIAKLQLVPDGIFTLQSRGVKFKAAFELELSRKSRRRLYRKLEAHVTNSDYNIALFVAGDEQILQLLWDVFNAVLVQSAEVKLKKQRNGIYFCTLGILRELQLEAPWKGERNTLILANLNESG